MKTKKVRQMRALIKWALAQKTNKTFAFGAASSTSLGQWTETEAEAAASTF